MLSKKRTTIRSPSKLLTALKQICNHPAQFLGDGSTLPGRSGKLDRLGEMLEEALSVGDRALVNVQNPVELSTVS